MYVCIAGWVAPPPEASVAPPARCSFRRPTRPYRKRNRNDQPSIQRFPPGWRRIDLAFWRRRGRRTEASEIEVTSRAVHHAVAYPLATTRAPPGRRTPKDRANDQPDQADDQDQKNEELDWSDVHCRTLSAGRGWPGASTRIDNGSRSVSRRRGGSQPNFRDLQERRAGTCEKQDNGRAGRPSSSWSLAEIASCGPARTVPHRLRAAPPKRAPTAKDPSQDFRSGPPRQTAPSRCQGSA